MESERTPTPSPARAGSVFLRHYDRLARIAFLVGPSGRAPQARLVRAHRDVHRALPWRSGRELTYPQMRRRVLRAATRRRLVRLPVLITWAWHTTVGGSAAHRTVAEGLAGLAPHARAAYVLVVVEGLTRADALAVMRDLGWADADAAMAAAAKLVTRLRDDHRLSGGQQRALLAESPADPTVVRLRAPDPLGVRLLRTGRVALVAAALSLVAGLLVGMPESAPGGGGTVGVRLVGPANAVARVPADAWTGTSELTLSAWPSRGARAGDDALVGAAASAWQVGGAGDRAVTVTAQGGAVTDPPVGTPALLFAGTVDGGTVVVLADATRVATYAERAGERTLIVQPAPEHDEYATSALRVPAGAGKARYLLAPWAAAPQTRALTGSRWRGLAVRDGLTEAVATPAGERCWNGPLLRLESTLVGHGLPYTLGDFGNAGLAHLMYIPPRVPGPISRPHELDATGGPAAWSRLGCALAGTRGRSPGSVTAWELWRGRLPRGAASLVCLRTAEPGSANQVAAVATAGEPAVVATASGTRLCSRYAQDVVVSWWTSDARGRWYHVAAGSHAVRRISVRTPAGTRQGTSPVVSGPFARRPAGKVTVTATNDDGAPVPVLG
ncbi:hypothetical protein [Phytohabitans houttuyneae]|uniref:DNA-directed RNA polymerase specialized sigma24 family protein n=1 Tax=Phytohabitans houttuyneae TaxID=1076126 RepID=A0A6V8K5E1_9ACTN|nr:hypothetical protein [Phytohabitans houttuyneae]GFJ77196.1 hypothetical protein Phou_013760 [Phytohabitans houttuyneae]